MAQYLYPLLPSAVSIIWICTSGYRGGYLERLTDNLHQSRLLSIGRDRNELIKLINNIASDWATRISFVGAVVALAVSYFVLLSVANAPTLEIAVFVFLLVVVALSVFFILRHGPGDLTAMTQTDLGDRSIPMKPANVLNALLVLLHFGLIVLILYSQLSSSQSSPP
jgi:hypothetical protein